MKSAAGEMNTEMTAEVVVSKALASVGHSVHRRGYPAPSYLDYDRPPVPGPASSTDLLHNCSIFLGIRLDISMEGASTPSYAK